MVKKLLFLIMVLIFLIACFFILDKFYLNQHSKENKQQLIQKTLELYNEKKAEGMNFSSQCLGVVEGYAVDIVHVPRSSEDNLVENQCKDYIEGKVHHFIELDKNGNVVRIV